MKKIPRKEIEGARVLTPLEMNSFHIGQRGVTVRKIKTPGKH